MQLEKRGFYPKGGGQAALTVCGLAPGSSLKAFDLTDWGEVTSITVSAFQAGQMNSDVAERMASAAAAALQKVHCLPSLNLLEKVLPLHHMGGGKGPLAEQQMALPSSWIDDPDIVLLCCDT